MMAMEREAGGSLFERIREATNPPVRRNSKEALLRSILSNLQGVLNTRSGSCHGSPELGIADLNDTILASGELRKKISEAISDCILRYEPRIADVVVTALTQDRYVPLDLCFRIAAYVDFSDNRDALEFDILLDNHQHWRVE